MPASDLIASYGALLATILAFIQLQEWRNKRKILSINYTQYYSDGDSDVLVTISNRSDRPTHIDFVGICAYERRRIKFWIWDDVSAKSLAKMKQRDPLLGEGVIDGETINPGQMIYGVANIAEFTDLSRFPRHDRREQKVRYGVILEHSMADKPLTRLFKLDFG
jgi:hypothetical protein